MERKGMKEEGMVCAWCRDQDFYGRLFQFIYIIFIE
jgi:hypothetical protein